MDLSKLHAVIVDDSILKAIEIRKALEFNRITNVDIVRNQGQLWEKINDGKKGGNRVNLIVTDMRYPLTAGADTDNEAGFKLIERMEQEHIDIPVIICSSSNYESVKGILGSVWYRQNDDINLQFREVLSRLV